MVDLYKQTRKTERKITVPRSELQLLSAAVQFCVNFRIQSCHLPRELYASAETHRLSSRIKELQADLKESLKADYERQKATIIAKREAKK